MAVSMSMAVGMFVWMGVLVRRLFRPVLMIVGVQLMPFVIVVRRDEGHVLSAPGARIKRNTAIAAPKPLSMLTTVTPDAQLVSMPKSAVRP